MKLWQIILGLLFWTWIIRAIYETYLSPRIKCQLCGDRMRKNRFPAHVKKTHSKVP